MIDVPYPAARHGFGRVALASVSIVVTRSKSRCFTGSASAGSAFALTVKFDDRMHGIGDVGHFRDVHFGRGSRLDPRVLAQCFRICSPMRSIGLPAQTGKDTFTSPKLG
ncbi:hypothetical protein [Bradyrhizobium sp. 2S1]|uniref:hypothetical protein n=1 Tax=Bradyrhizobium sp. 2S1 TaxID=1404429 RepID=UPI00140A96E0|nr:hypothetical protein [Bradyrhizobium sp. 2S1]MCK7669972.1 hypothetical protein [Bradyrhizobium sp. 2S1]